MTVSVTPLLTTIHDCESVTVASPGLGTWSSSPALDADVKKQGNNSISTISRNTTETYWFDLGGTIDMTAEDRHFYFWFNFTAPPSLLGTTIGSGTGNESGIRCRIGTSESVYEEWYLDGANTYPGGWVRYVVDPNSTSDATAGSPNLANAAFFCVVVEVGLAANKTNTYVDILHYGTGLQIEGGTTGNRGTFAEIAANDLSNGYGILTESDGVYFSKGELVFGDDTGTADVYFEDDNSPVVFFADQVVSDTLYKIKVTGGTGHNHFQLGSKLGSGTSALGAQGAFVGSGGPAYRLDFADSGIDVCHLYGSVFRNAGNVFLGDTGEPMGGDTGTEIIDTALVGCNHVDRNIAISAGAVVLNNEISFTTDTGTSGYPYSLMDLDGEGFNWDRFNLIAGYGMAAAADVVSIDYTNVQNSQDILVSEGQQLWECYNPTWGSSGYPILAWDADSGQVHEIYDYQVDVVDLNGDGLSYSRIYAIDRSDGELQVASVSDGDGYLLGEITEKEWHDGQTGAPTVSHGPFSQRIFKFGKTPSEQNLGDIAAALALDVTLIDDAALAGVTGQPDIGTGEVYLVDPDDTYPALLMDYDAGTGGGYSALELVGAGAAAARVVEIIGDADAGTLVLDQWNGNGFVDNAPVTGATSGHYALADTATLYQPYSWLLDAQNNTLADMYEWFSWEFADTGTPSTEITRAVKERVQLLGRSGTDYSTSRAQDWTDEWHGVFVVNRSAGNVVGFESDSGVDYVPPVQRTHTLTGIVQNSEVTYVRVSDEEVLYNVENVGAGGETNYSYQYQSDTPVTVLVFHVNYGPVDIAVTLGNADASLPIQQVADPFYSNP